jgi:hypothetical protein
MIDTHRYRVGQTVRFVKAASGTGIGGTPDGSFEVVRLLPEYLGTYQYRVKSTGDGHERVVGEGEIALR